MPQRIPRNVCGLILLLAVTLLPSGLAQNRPIPESGNEKKRDKKHAGAEPDLIRWRGMLDQLTDQSRAVGDEKVRAQLIAETAFAYWNLDKTKSAELFEAALEAASNISIARGTSNSAIRKVIGLAARCDAAMAKRLTERFTELRAKDIRSTSASIEAAADLLKVDAKLAAQVAETSAPAGLSSDSAGAFILELAQQEPTAAERVYRAYLNKLASVQVLPLGQLLWLAGYPFGYGEAYGFPNNNPTRITGFGGRQIAGLAPNPTLAKMFLDIAFRSAEKTLQFAATATPDARDLLHGMVLFAAGYLSPEVARYRPETSDTWRILQQQAQAGTSARLQQQVGQNIESILNNRSVGERQAQSMDDHANEQILASLDNAAKLPEGCERDRAYAEAALTVGGTKDFQRALSTTEVIKNTALRNSVIQFLHHEMSKAAIEAGNLADAQRHAARVEARDQRVLLYVKTAEAALRQKDQVLANQLLSEVRQLASGGGDREAQTAVLLAAAAVYAQFDAAVAGSTVKEAVQAVNQSRRSNVETFAVLRKVKLACPGDAYERWYGSYDQPDQFSLLETLALLSRSDVDGSILVAQAIEDAPTRIRATLAIVNAVIKENSISAKTAEQ